MNGNDRDAVIPMTGEELWLLVYNELCGLSAEQNHADVTDKIIGLVLDAARQWVNKDNHVGRLVDVYYVNKALDELGKSRPLPGEGWVATVEDRHLAAQIMDDVDGARPAGLTTAAQRIAAYRRMVVLRRVLEDK